MQASAWWPALVSVVDHALARGESLDALLSMASTHDDTVDVDDCQALVWRVSLLTDPSPTDNDAAPPTPEDFDDDLEWIPPTTAGTRARPRNTGRTRSCSAAQRCSTEDALAALGAAALARTGMGVLEPTPAQVESMVAHAAQWDDAPFTPERAAHINHIAGRYYASMLEAGWAGPYLRDRLRTDQAPTGAGYAPPGWTHLTTHLRRHGVTDDEMLAAGLVTRARTGTLIDRFRDRLVLPITAEDTVVGFVARRHPDADDSRGPEVPQHPHHRPVPQGRGALRGRPAAHRRRRHPRPRRRPPRRPRRHLRRTRALPRRRSPGHLTHRNPSQAPGHLHPEPIVATDADPAGRAAAERAYWLLTQHAVSPRSVALPDGSDPADILHRCGPEALAASIDGAHPLAQDLIDGRLAHTSGPTSIKDLAAVIAADAPSRWLTQARDLTERTDAKLAQVLTDLAEATQRWNRQPSLTAQHQLSAASEHRVARAPGAVGQPNSAAVGDVPNGEALPTTEARADGPPQNPHPGRRLAERGQWPKPSQTNRRSIER